MSDSLRGKGYREAVEEKSGVYMEGLARVIQGCRRGVSVAWIRHIFICRVFIGGSSGGEVEESAAAESVL